MWIAFWRHRLESYDNALELLSSRLAVSPSRGRHPQDRVAEGRRAEAGPLGGQHAAVALLLAMPYKTNDVHWEGLDWFLLSAGH